MADLRTCPNCRNSFKPKLLLAIKLGRKRLERCPHCRKWVDVYAPLPAAEEKRERRESSISEEDMLRRRIEESKEERT